MRFLLLTPKISQYYFLCFIVLLITGCSNRSSNAAYRRFERVVKESRLPVPVGRSRFLLWNDNACHGCKVKCVNFLSMHPEVNICIIAPYADRKLAALLPADKYWIDSANLFGRYDYGVSNVGLVELYQGKVNRINNYHVAQMDSLEHDLLNSHKAGR